MRLVHSCLSLLLLAVEAQSEAVVQDDLCSTWSQINEGKCEAGQQCCVVEKNGDSTCSDPIEPDSGTFVTQEGMQFASDGTYKKEWTMSTGSCPFDAGSGTIILMIQTFGDYALAEENEDVAGFTKVMYTPQSFTVALTKTQKDMYYTPQDPGPCMSPQSFLTSAALGCPCNGNWTVDSSWSQEDGYETTRTVVPSECPEGTCEDTFFFGTAAEYGNIRFDSTETTLDLTAPSADEGVGYSTAKVLYSFQGDGECEASIDDQPTAQMNHGTYLTLQLSWAASVSVTFSFFAMIA